MKKIILALSLIIILFNLSAQRSSFLQESPFSIDNQTPQILVNNSRAAGDTLFFFNGRYISGKGIVNSNSSLYSLQDIDQKTLSARYTSLGYPSKAAFLISNQTKSPGDTNFYFAAVSDFIPAGTANDWMSVGPIKIPATGATLYWKHNYPDGDFRDAYKVHINIVGLGAANFTATPIFTVADNENSTKADTAKTPVFVFYRRSVSLAAYAGKSIYIGFQHTAVNQDRVLIDDIFVKEYADTDIGIDENNSTEEVTIYPNPSSGVFTFNLINTGKIQVEVYNLFGEMVYSQNFSTYNVTLDLTGLKAGIYCVKGITFNQKRFIKQVVISQ